MGDGKRETKPGTHRCPTDGTSEGGRVSGWNRSGAGRYSGDARAFEVLPAVNPWALLLAASGYLLGSVSFAVLVVRLKTGKDIRAVGSGNAGATNVLLATS